MMVRFTHEGRTFDMDADKATRAKVIILPTGALVGLELSETFPPTVIAVRNVPVLDADKHVEDGGKWENDVTEVPKA